MTLSLITNPASSGEYQHDNDRPPASTVRRRTDNDGLHKRRGVWHYKLRVDGRWRELSTRTRNYQEARKVRQAAVEAERTGRLPTDLARCPFNKVAEDWLAMRKATVAAKTYASDRGRLKPLLKAFGNRPLEELVANGGALLRSYQLRRAAQVGARTNNMELTVARQILRSARLWKRIEDDVKSLHEPSGGPGRALSPEEEQRLWEMARARPDAQVAYWCGLLAVNTAMRGGEIKHLRLRDVDLTARQLNIRRSKTEAGVRMIPLNPTAQWALLQLAQRAAKLGAVKPEHYLLPHRMRDATYDLNRPQLTWRTAWRKLTRAAGLPGLRFHDLRHTAVTKLGEAGVAEATMKAIVGHLSVRMLEHYSHIRVQAKRDAVEKLCTSITTPPPTPVAPEVTEVVQ
jgi:integrase